MRIVIIYNKDLDNVVSKLGSQNKEIYREETIHRVASALLKYGFEVKLIDGNLEMFRELQKIDQSSDKIPFVFNLAYGIQGEDRYSHIPSALEMLGLPYLGSSPVGHTLALDKTVAKLIMQYHKIPTPDFRVFELGEEIINDLNYPVIVKPSREADSFGMKIVNNIDELKDAVNFLFEEYNQSVFAESFISGREFALGLMGNGANIESLPLVEIDLNQDENAIQTNADKKFNPRRKIVPADVEPEVLKRMKYEAKRLFRLLRLKDYGRADIRMDSRGNFYFLEINSMVSLGQTGSFVAAAEAAGYDYDSLIRKLLDIAVSKYFGNRQKLKVRYETRYQEDRGKV